MQIEQPVSKEVATALRALEREQIGLEFTADRTVCLSCTRKRMLLLFQRDATAVEQISQNKGLLGVIAEMDAANNDWTPGYYLFTRPAEEANYVQIDLLRFSGRRHAIGRGRVIRGRLDFAVAGIQGRGIFPLRLSGSLDADYRLRLDTAEAGLAAQSASVMPHSSPNYLPWP